MKGAIAVFVKTPGLSRIKTRLAAGIGSARAEEFHLISAFAVCAVAKRATASLGASVFFAVAESAGMDSPHWQGTDRIFQGVGGLGARMRKVYSNLMENHGYAILLGADSPQMETGDLESAASWLLDGVEARLAYAPAADGGFWLFGGNRSLPEHLWTSVEYGRPDTGERFKSLMEAHGKLTTMRTLIDADRPEDLSALLSGLRRLSSPLPEQTQVVRILEDLP